MPLAEPQAARRGVLCLAPSSPSAASQDAQTWSLRPLWHCGGCSAAHACPASLCPLPDSSSVLPRLHTHLAECSPSPNRAGPASREPCVQPRVARGRNPIPAQVGVFCASVLKCRHKTRGWVGWGQEGRDAGGCRDAGGVASRAQGCMDGYERASTEGRGGPVVFCVLCSVQPVGPLPALPAHPIAW